MNKDKWKVIKFKFEQTLKSWELDKSFNQFTVDSIHSLFPTEIEVIIDYIEELENIIKDLQQEKYIRKELKKWLCELSTSHELYISPLKVVHKIKELEEGVK